MDDGEKLLGPVANKQWKTLGISGYSENNPSSISLWCIEVRV